MAYTFKWRLTKEVIRLSYSCPEIKLNGDFANIITLAFMLLPGMFKRGIGDEYKVIISEDFSSPPFYEDKEEEADFKLINDYIREQDFFR